MNTIEFYGASDDLIEVDGDVPGCDEYNGEHGLFEVCGLRVEVEYMTNGCWGVRVFQIDESVPVTAEDVTLRVGEGRTPETLADPGVLAGTAPAPHPDYSMVLSMRVPDGSHVTVLP